MQNDPLRQEAQIFGSYLLGRPVDETVINLYIQAHRNIPFILDEKDQRLLNLILRQPFWLAFVESGLLLYKRNSHLRKKIYYMLAILETQPACADQFLYQNSWVGHILSMGFFGLRGLFNMAVGTLICIIA